MICLLQWAERLLDGGGQEQWGDKWTETFGHGKGTKHGEVGHYTYPTRPFPAHHRPAACVRAILMVFGCLCGLFRAVFVP